MNDEAGQNEGKRPFEVTHPHLKDFRTFLPELNNESDRGMSLIATSFIDEQLKRTLSAFLIEGADSEMLLKGFNAPLGTFSARIAATAAMGLISAKEAREIHCLRKIRNLFAHHVHVSFDDQNIRDLCSNLEMAAEDYGDVVVGARGRFSTSAVSVIMSLTNRPHYVARARLRYTGWEY
jgi:mannitol operon repressor